MAKLHSKSPKPIPQLSAKDIQRFHSHVDRRGPDECWPWKLIPELTGGYGFFTAQRRKMHANRVSYFIHFGQDPLARFVLHSCDNPICVNPKHLSLGTQLQNKRDSMSKRRHAHGSRMGWAKLTEDQVKEIRAKYATGRYTQTELARTYAVRQTSISMIVHRVTWRHVP